MSARARTEVPLERFLAAPNEKAPREAGPIAGKTAFRGLQKSSSPSLLSVIETGVAGDGSAIEPLTTGSSATG